MLSVHPTNPNAIEPMNESVQYPTHAMHSIPLVHAVHPSPFPWLDSYSYSVHSTRMTMTLPLCLCCRQSERIADCRLTTRRYQLTPDDNAREECPYLTTRSTHCVAPLTVCRVKEREIECGLWHCSKKTALLALPGG